MTAAALTSTERSRKRRTRLKAEARAQAKAARADAGSSPAAWMRRHWVMPNGVRTVPVRYMDALLAIAACRQPPRVMLVRKSIQLGYTEAVSSLACWAYLRGQSVLAYQTSDTEARAYSVDTLSRAFDAVPALARTAATSRDRMQRISAMGGSIRVQGAVRPSRFRRTVASITVLDELDSYAPSIGGEGSALELSLRAGENVDGILLAGSTPTGARGPSQIAAAAEHAHMNFVFAFPCPRCGQATDMSWERFDFDSLTMGCVACHGRFGRAAAHRAMGKGFWAQAEIAPDEPWPLLAPDGERVVRGKLASGAPWQETVGFHIWAAYSRWTPWQRLVDRWHRAQRDRDALRVFIEHYLARPYYEEDTPPEKGKLALSAAPLGVLPESTYACYCVVDVQKTWLSAMRVAFDMDGTATIVSRDEFHGETAAHTPWRELGAWLDALPALPTERGALIPNWLIVDVGYSQEDVILHTHQLVAEAKRVYNVRFVKGASGWSREAMRTTKTANGQTIHIVGVDSVKRAMLSQLAELKVRLSDTLDDAVFDELASEAVQMKRTKSGRRVPAFVQLRDRNEALDTLTYAACVFRAHRVAAPPDPVR